MTLSTCLAFLSYGEGSGRRGTPERFLQLGVKRWTVAFHRVFAVTDCRDCVTAVGSPASSRPLLGSELKVARRIGLGVCCLAQIHNGCPCQPPTCLHHLKFPNRNLSAPKCRLPSGFPSGLSMVGLKPVGWSAGISVRKVGGGFHPSWFRFQNVSTPVSVCAKEKWVEVPKSATAGKLHIHGMRGFRSHAMFSLSLFTFQPVNNMRGVFLTR